MRVTIKSSLGNCELHCRDFPYKAVNSILKKERPFTYLDVDQVVCNKCLKIIFTWNRYHHKCSEVLDFEPIDKPADIELNLELLEDDL